MTPIEATVEATTTAAQRMTSRRRVVTTFTRVK